MVQQGSVNEWFDSLGLEIVLMDGTFWSKNELSRQNDVPHPPVEDSSREIKQSN